MSLEAFQHSSCQRFEIVLYVMNTKYHQIMQSSSALEQFSLCVQTSEASLGLAGDLNTGTQYVGSEPTHLGGKRAYSDLWSGDMQQQDQNSAFT